jgi:hypothetical protein
MSDLQFRSYWVRNFKEANLARSLRGAAARSDTGSIELMVITHPEVTIPDGVEVDWHKETGSQFEAVSDGVVVDDTIIAYMISTENPDELVDVKIPIECIREMEVSYREVPLGIYRKPDPKRYVSAEEVAAACGITVDAVKDRAARENWPTVWVNLPAAG